MKPDKVYVDLPPFTGRNVPVTEIAKAMHKDAQYVRVGIQQGMTRTATRGTTLAPATAKSTGIGSSTTSLMKRT